MRQQTDLDDVRIVQLRLIILIAGFANRIESHFVKFDVELKISVYFFTLLLIRAKLISFRIPAVPYLYRISVNISSIEVVSEKFRSSAIIAACLLRKYSEILHVPANNIAASRDLLESNGSE